MMASEGGSILVYVLSLEKSTIEAFLSSKGVLSNPQPTFDPAGRSEFLRKITLKTEFVWEYDRSYILLNKKLKCPLKPTSDKHTFLAYPLEILADGRKILMAYQEFANNISSNKGMIECFGLEFLKEIAGAISPAFARAYIASLNEGLLIQNTMQDICYLHSSITSILGLTMILLGANDNNVTMPRLAIDLSTPKMQEIIKAYPFLTSQQKKYLETGFKRNPINTLSAQFLSNPKTAIENSLHLSENQKEISNVRENVLNRFFVNKSSRLNPTDIDKKIEVLSLEITKTLLKNLSLLNSDQFYEFLVFIINYHFTDEEGFKNLSKDLKGLEFYFGKIPAEDFRKKIAPELRKLKSGDIFAERILGVMEVFSRAYEHERDIFYKLCPDLFANVKFMSIESVLHDWNKCLYIFSPVHKKNNEFHNKNLAAVIRRIAVRNYQDYQRAVKSGDFRYLESMLFYVDFEILADRNLFFQFLEKIIETEEKSDERKIGLQILEKTFKLEEAKGPEEGVLLIKNEISREKITYNFSSNALFNLVFPQHIEELDMMGIESTVQKEDWIGLIYDINRYQDKVKKKQENDKKTINILPQNDQEKLEPLPAIFDIISQNVLRQLYRLMVDNLTEERLDMVLNHKRIPTEVAKKKKKNKKGRLMEQSIGFAGGRNRDRRNFDMGMMGEFGAFGLEDEMDDRMDTMEKSTPRTEKLGRLLAIEKISLDEILARNQSSLRAFKEKLNQIFLIIGCYYGQINTTLRTKLFEVKNSVKETMINRLALKDDLLIIYQVIENDLYLLPSDLFIYHLTKMLTQNEFKDNIKNLKKALENTINLVYDLLIVNLQNKTLKYYLEADVPKTIQDPKSESKIWIQKFNKKIVEADKMSIETLILWFSRKDEVKYLKIICYSLNILFLKLYKTKESKTFKIFEKNNDTSFFKVLPDLTIIWDILHPHNVPTKKVLELISGIEEEIKLIRNTELKRLQDVSELLRDPTQVANLGNRCNVSDISMIQLIKEKDRILQESKKEELEFMKEMIKIYSDLFAGNQQFLGHIERFTKQQEVEYLTNIFSNVGNQSKLVSSTVRNILRRDSNPCLLISSNYVHWEIKLDVKIEASLRDSEGGATSLTFSKRDLDEYYQILNIENDQSEDNEVFFALYTDINEITAILQKMHEVGYDVENEIESQSLSRIRIFEAAQTQMRSEITRTKRHKLEENYREWKKICKRFYIAYPFLNLLCRRELPLLIQIIQLSNNERIRREVEIYHILKLIGYQEPKDILEKFYAKTEEIKRQKTFASKVEMISEIIQNNPPISIYAPPPLALKSSKSFSQHGPELPKLSMWAVDDNDFFRVLCSALLIENETNLPPSKNIMIMSEKIPRTFIKSFFSRIESQQGIYISIIPKSSNLTANSKVIKYFARKLAETGSKPMKIRSKIVVIYDKEFKPEELITETTRTIDHADEADYKSIEEIACHMNDEYNHKKKQEPEVRWYCSSRAGLGKSYEIKKILLKDKKGAMHIGEQNGVYHEITIGGHIDFNLWIERIWESLRIKRSTDQVCSHFQLLAEMDRKNKKCEDCEKIGQKKILNLVIGVPGVLDREDDMQSFYTNLDLFLGILVVFRSYRSPQGYIELSDNIILQIEASNSPARIIQKYMKLQHYLPTFEVKPFELSRFEFEIDGVNLENRFKIFSKDVRTSGPNSKIINLLYAFKRLDQKQLTERIRFPILGCKFGMTNETYKKVLDVNIYQKLMEYNKEFGAFTYSNFLETVNILFYEFNDFNASTMETIGEIKKKTLRLPSGEIDKIQVSQANLLKEILKFCIIYSASSAANFIESQKNAMENQTIGSFMDDLHKEKNIVRFEELKVVLMYFSKDRFHLLFKDPAHVESSIKHSYTMQIYALAALETLGTYLTGQFEGKKPMEVLKEYFNERNRKPDYYKPQLFPSLTENADELWARLGLILDISNSEIEKIRQQSQFVLTCDGFLKTIIIAKKLRARYPVILIGETGTGKTYLMNFLSKYILHHIFAVEHNQMCKDLTYKKIEFNYQLIHAGFCEDDIIIVLNNEFKKCEANADILYLLFLDEFNTANSVDLLSDLITKRKLLGKDIPMNLICIGACNPFVLKKKSKQQEEDDEQSALVHPKGGSKFAYSVNPLTENEIMFLMDFGQMTQKQETMYSNALIEDNLKNFGLNKQQSDVIVKLVGKCQQFTKEYEGPSSMSIRDIKKYIRAYQWINEVYYKVRIIPKFSPAVAKAPEPKKGATASTNKSSISEGQYKLQLPLILSIWLVYYLRIVRNKRRAEFITFFEKEYEAATKEKINFNEFVTQEQLFLLNNISLEDGVAKNTPLRENVLALFICLCSKVSILICGKPGCSKTLAINILNDNLKSFNSPTPFMREAQFPNLILTYYQGSTSSRSEGVVSAFENATHIAKTHSPTHYNRKGANAADSSKYLVVLIFDELGLAELSPYNPLKVLHGYLDNDDLPCGFVGISNWGLDAAKNNRAVFVARPDLTQEDLKITASDISSTYNKEFPVKYKKIWDGLADSYYDFIQQQARTLNKVFHGPRDFYSLIKSISSEIRSQINQKNLTLGEVNENLAELIRLKIYRNFGGLAQSGNEFVNFFTNKTKMLEFKKISINDIIADYLRSDHLRYVMAIGKGGEYYCLRMITESILKKNNNLVDENTLVRDKKNVHMISGSDKKESPEEGEKRVSKDLELIQQYLRNGDLIILNNYPDIYTSLYELFNMKRRKINDKVFCEIAFSSKTNRHVEISPSAKIIVLIDQDKLDNEQAPFLNRFEKFILNFDDILEQSELKMIGEVTKLFKSVFWETKKSNEIYLKSSRVMPLIHEEYLKSLTITIKAKKKISNLEDLKNNLIKKVVRSVAPEFLFHLQIAYDDKRIEKETYDKIYSRIKEYYIKFPKFESFTDNIRKKKMSKGCKVLFFSFYWSMGMIMDVIKSNIDKALIECPIDEMEQKIKNKITEEGDIGKLVFLTSVSDEKELSSITKLDFLKIDSLNLVVRVPLRRCQEEFDQSSLRYCFPTNGWKSFFVDSLSPKFEEIDDLIKQKDANSAFKSVSETRMFFVESLMKNMLQIGVSLNIDEHSTFNQRINELKDALEIINDVLKDWITDNIHSNANLLVDIKKSVYDDWRKNTLIDAKLNALAESIWKIPHIPLQKYLKSDENITKQTTIFQILRGLINYGIPQSLRTMRKLQVKENIQEFIYNHFVFDRKEIILKYNSKTANLHYPFNVMVVWANIQEEYKKHEREIKLAEDFVRLWNKKIDPEILVKKYFDVTRLFAPFNEIIEGQLKDEISNLLVLDVITFFEEKHVELGTPSGKKIVEFLKNNNPFLSSTKINKHEALFFALFYSKKLLSSIVKLIEELDLSYKNIEINPIMFDTNVIKEGFFKVISNGALKTDSKKISVYSRFKDLQKVLEVEASNLEWLIIDTIYTVYESLHFEENEDAIGQFHKKIEEYCRSKNRTLTRLIEIIFELSSETRPVTLKKGISAVLSIGKSIQEKELSSLYSVIFKNCFTDFTTLQLLLKIIYGILEEDYESALSETNLPSYVIQNEVYITGTPENTRVYRALLYKLFLNRAEREIGSKDPWKLYKWIFNNYTKKKDFIQNYFIKDEGLIKQSYVVKIRAHVWTISAVFTEMANNNELYIDTITNAEINDAVWFCFMHGKNKEENDFIDFTQKVIVRRTIKNGTSLSAIGAFAANKNLRFDLLQGNLKSDFMYLIKGSLDPRLFQKLRTNLTDSFFGRQSFYELSQADENKPYFLWNLLQIFLNNYLVYNDADKDKVKLSSDNLKKALHSLTACPVITDNVKLLLNNYCFNMEKLKSLQISSKNPPKDLLRNLCIGTILNSAILDKSGLSDLFLASVKNVDSMHIPGSFDEKTKNYLYILQLNIAWRNYNDNWTANTHLLLECKACGNLNPLFACNHPHEGKQCQPGKCSKIVDTNYVKDNHINDHHIELPKRIKSLLYEKNVKKLFDIAESKGNIRVGDVHLISLKVIHLFFLSVFYIMIPQSPHIYSRLALKWFEISSENDIHDRIGGMIQNYIKGMCENLKTAEEDGYVWVCGVLVKVFEELQNGGNKICFNTLDGRIQFEKLIDKLVIKYYTENDNTDSSPSPQIIQQAIYEFKEQFKNENASEMVKIIMESERDKESTYYQAINEEIELAEVSMNQIIEELNDVKCPAEITKLVWSQEHFDKLNRLPNLISFYEKMIYKYKNLIKPRDTKTKKIKDYIELGKTSGTWADFPYEFEEFKNLWDEIRLVGLRCGCKDLKYIGINEEDSIGFLLPTWKESRGTTDIEKQKGMYLIGGIQTLAKIQNDIIQRSIDTYDYIAKNILDEKVQQKLDLEHVVENDLIHLDMPLPKFLELHVSFKVDISNYNLTLKPSADFKMLDRDLMTKIVRGKRKIIDDEKEFQEYSYSSSILLENIYLDFIDPLVGVRTLPMSEWTELNDLIKSMQEKSIKYVDDLLSEFQQVIILMKETKKADPKLSIKEYARSFESDILRYPLINQIEILTKIPMSSIKKVLELVELRWVLGEIEINATDFKDYLDEIPDLKKLENMFEESNNALQLLLDFRSCLSIVISRLLLKDIDVDKVFLKSPLNTYIDPFLNIVCEKDESRINNLGDFIDNTGFLCVGQAASLLKAMNQKIETLK